MSRWWRQDAARHAAKYARWDRRQIAGARPAKAVLSTGSQGVPFNKQALARFDHYVG